MKQSEAAKKQDMVQFMLDSPLSLKYIYISNKSNDMSYSFTGPTKLLQRGSTLFCVVRITCNSWELFYRSAVSKQSTGSWFSCSHLIVLKGMDEEPEESAVYMNVQRRSAAGTVKYNRLCKKYKCKTFGSEMVCHCHIIWSTDYLLLWFSSRSINKSPSTKPIEWMTPW